MRRSAKKILALSVAAIGAMAIASVVNFSPRFVWNASASAPIGLYQIEDRAPQLGDFLLVKPDPELEKLIAARGYLPEGVPLLKRVAALAGDKICRKSEAIFINGTYVAEAGIFDSAGRKLPHWSSCFVLGKHELFLLNDHEKSLDGRYFGATKSDHLIGVAIPLWTKESEG